MPYSDESSPCPVNCECNDDALSATCRENTLSEVPITLNPRIEKLTLKQNRIKTIDAASFQFYGLLLFIDFSHNQLVKVPPRVFGAQTKLLELHLNHNKLSNITDATFYNLKSLLVLNLRNNYLEELPDKVFAPLTSLRHLDLSQNRIQRVEPATFYGLSQLNVLLIEDNQLTAVPTSSFQHLETLAELRVGLNAFRTLLNNSFAGLATLSTLDLTGAGLTNMSEYAFHGLDQNLRTLILSDNRLVTVPTKQLSRLSRLEELSIGQNPFTQLPRNAFKGLINLRTLIVAGASELRSIENGAFADNLNLESLTLTSNKRLSQLADGSLTGLPNLKDLVLRDNGFVSFRESLAAWPELRKLDLSENPLECDCSLKWLRDLLTQRNTTHVLCAEPSSLKDKSLKQMTNEDLGCSTYYVSSHQTLIGAICGVVVALIAVLLFLIYRYRHRVRDVFKNYEWRKQTKGASTKQAEYQKTFNDDEFIIRTGPHQTLKPIPVTEL
jgi:Leucine-rich repeat (LRR) protein